MRNLSFVSIWKRCLLGLLLGSKLSFRIRIFKLFYFTCDERILLSALKRRRGKRMFLGHIFTFQGISLTGVPQQSGPNLLNKFFSLLEFIELQNCPIIFISMLRALIEKHVRLLFGHIIESLSLLLNADLAIPPHCVKVFLDVLELVLECRVDRILI